jgi:N-acetylglucosamine-6-sulfatase
MLSFISGMLVRMRPLRRLVLAAVATATAALLAAWAPAVPAVHATAHQGPPNIVFVLTDDLGWNLLPFMPQVQRLRADGMTFTNYTVTDSLCCPSRSSIFTGEFPHDTGVYTNAGPDGGFATFRARGNEAHTYATALRAKGYATALMGKYLNGYLPGGQPGETPRVPAGWSEWDAAGYAYDGYDYDLNVNGNVVHYGAAPADYLTDVLSARGQSFIRRAAAAGTPFALEIATFAPHSPYVAAPVDTDEFPGLTAPRTAAFDRVPTAAPAWDANQPPLTRAEAAHIDTVFRKRAQAVQAVDGMVGDLRRTLAAAGVADDTYVVFSSDNGFHLGEHRLTPGKQTAFDADVRVPLVVAGPGVAPATTNTAITQNIDLAPTFERIARAAVPERVDGHSLLPLLHGGYGAGWRTVALVEHHGPNTLPGDPDVQSPRGGNPPTYTAIRGDMWTYVEYADGAREYYDRATDPDELHNIVAGLSAPRLGELHTVLAELAGCHGHAGCWAAGRDYGRVSSGRRAVASIP